MKKMILFSILLLIVAPFALAESHMTLLAVKDAPDGLVGSTAELYLDIVPGKGRVFIESFPLTKLDTQISTRFAKEIACDFIDYECDRYDFFYTLKSDSPIIGGPSAGAAISVLTAAALLKEDIREDAAMTGTINSGGLIGPVSGLRQKVEIAPSKGLNIVLIPSGQKKITQMNLTWNLAEYAEPYGTTVIEVTDIGDALSFFTGKDFKKKQKDIGISGYYENTMKGLAMDLCNKTYELREQAGKFVENKTIELNESAFNITEKAEGAFENKMFYSAASYCFGANVRYRAIILNSQEPDFNDTEQMIKKMSNNLERIPVKTITDLETYMVVKERLVEAEEGLEEAKEAYANQTNETEGWYFTYAYAIERLSTAEAWSKFFGKPGKEFEFNKEVLQKSCIDKISEAEERHQYVELIIPNFFENIKKDIELAYKYAGNEDYELCLYQASKAKASANYITGLMGVEEDYMDLLVDNKLKAVKYMIAEEQSKGIFPIVGYSYYEYSNSLKEEEASSALLYAEQALELSNLDMYFKEKKGYHFRWNADREATTAFAVGILTGMLIMLLIKILRKY